MRETRERTNERITIETSLKVIKGNLCIRVSFFYVTKNAVVRGYFSNVITNIVVK